MKRARILFVARALSAIGCLVGFGFSALPAQAAPATTDTVNVVTFSSGAVVAPGIATSTLVRNDNGVAMTIHTVGLPANTADTVWWVIFNNPGACSHGIPGIRCGLGDLFVPAVKASVQFAAGHLISSDGIGDYGSYLRENDTSGCATAALPCNGLFNSRTADVHIVVRTHGAPIPGLIPDQIHSFNGGCPPNTCKNLQAAPHEV